MSADVSTTDIMADEGGFVNHYFYDYDEGTECARLGRSRVRQGEVLEPTQAAPLWDIAAPGDGRTPPPYL